MRQYNKVRHTLVRDGKNLGHYNSDLVYIREIPHAVLEWLVLPDGAEQPSICVALDSSKLHSLPWQSAQFYYELPIVWPGTEK